MLKFAKEKKITNVKRIITTEGDANKKRGAVEHVQGSGSFLELYCADEKKGGASLTLACINKNVMCESPVGEFAGEGQKPNNFEFFFLVLSIIQIKNLIQLRVISPLLFSNLLLLLLILAATATIIVFNISQNFPQLWRQRSRPQRSGRLETTHQVTVTNTSAPPWTVMLLFVRVLFKAEA